MDNERVEGLSDISRIMGTKITEGVLKLVDRGLDPIINTLEKDDTLKLTEVEIVSLVKDIRVEVGVAYLSTILISEMKSVTNPTTKDKKLIHEMVNNIAGSIHEDFEMMLDTKQFKKWKLK